MADLAIADLVKRFGTVTAVDNVSFDVREGEFLTLLGPSGCGKSTMLAAIAGLERPTGGRIAIGGETCSIRRPASSSTRSSAISA